MRHRSFQTRVGFTLVELLVVISIIGLLVGLLLPSLSAARQSAIAAGTNTALNSFGRSFFIHSDQSGGQEGELCSGAFDHLRDGNSQRVGWVADVVKNKIINPNKALDASNPSKLNEKVGDYTGATNLTGKANNKIWGTKDNVFYGGANGPKNDNTTKPKTAAQRREELWDGGINTNFATSWTFVRGDQKDGSAGALSSNADNRDPSKCPLDGEGPLSEDRLMNCRATREAIPLVANSRNGDGGDAAIDATRAATINAFFGFDQPGEKAIAKAGDFMVESFCDGKGCRQYDADVAAAFSLNSGAAMTSDSTAAADTLYEFNDFYPVVGARKNSDGVFTGGSCQILFADGHAEKIKDAGGFDDNSDGWIGPFKQGGAASATNSSAWYELNASGLREVRGKVWLKDLGTADSAGAGGSADE